MMMKEMAYEIERLQVKAEKINSLQNAIFEAIYNGNNAPETYEWAFVAFGDLTFSLKDELNELKRKAFDSFRKDGGDNVD